MVVRCSPLDGIGWLLDNRADAGPAFYCPEHKP
jgi:hypothetical protein